jgi:transcriptional regulator with XRE-family HTH domain
MASPVGTLMQHWRRERRMSQLHLAGEAGVTQRHVSFVESGRTQPSREMVLTLARAHELRRRAGERRVGEEGKSKGRSRWWQEE